MHTDSPVQFDSSAHQVGDIRLLWRRLADGLLIQRATLHRGEFVDIIDNDSTLLDIVGHGSAVRPADLVCSTTHATDWRSLEPFSGSLAEQIEYWFELPHNVTNGRIGNDRLCEATFAAFANSGAPDDPLLRALACTSSWWVGFFGVLRHCGVNHRTLTTSLNPVPFAALVRAAELVTEGLMCRVLSRIDPSKSTDSTAYFGAIARLVASEPEITDLLDQLEELRLVDLVSLNVPWRGQFVKYSSGAGPGQVE